MHLELDSIWKAHPENEGLDAVFGPPFTWRRSCRLGPVSSLLNIIFQAPPSPPRVYSWHLKFQLGKCPPSLICRRSSSFLSGWSLLPKYKLSDQFSCVKQTRNIIDLVIRSQNNHEILFRSLRLLWFSPFQRFKLCICSISQIRKKFSQPTLKTRPFTQKSHDKKDYHTKIYIKLLTRTYTWENLVSCCSFFWRGGCCSKQRIKNRYEACNQISLPTPSRANSSIAHGHLSTFKDCISALSISTCHMIAHRPAYAAHEHIFVSSLDRFLTWFVLVTNQRPQRPITGGLLFHRANFADQGGKSEIPDQIWAKKATVCYCQIGQEK